MAQPDNTAQQNAAEDSQVFVSGKQVEIGLTLQEHVKAQMRGLAAKYFGNAVEASATFCKHPKGIRFTCQARMHAGRGMYFDGYGEHGTAQGAFAEALEHVAKQLRRQKRAMREDKPINATKAGALDQHTAPVRDSEEDALPSFEEVRDRPLSAGLGAGMG